MVQAFLTALAARDLEAAMSHWLPGSPYRQEQRQELTKTFRRFGRLQVSNVKWVHARAEGPWVAVRVKLDIELRELARDGVDARKGENWTFLLSAEQDAWRIHRLEHSERFLAEALLRAPDEGAREAKLSEEPDLFRPMLIEQIGEAVLAAPNLSPAERLKLLDMAVALAERMGKPEARGRALLDRGTYQYQIDRYAGAESDLKQAIPLLEASGMPGALSDARFTLGITHLYRSRFREAEAMLGLEERMAEVAGATRLLAQIRYWLGVARHSQQDFAGAQRAYESSAELAARHKDLPGEARARHKLGDVLRAQRRDREAIQAWERAADLYQDGKMPREEAEVLRDIGVMYGALGQFFYSYSAQFRRLRVVTELKDRPLQADSLAQLASTLMAMGRISNAMEFLQLELELRRHLEDRHGESVALREMGYALRDLARFTEAETVLRQSLELARKLRDRDPEARTLAELSRLLGETGEFRSAVEAGERAVSLFRELQNPNVQADTLRELGRQYRAQGRHAEAMARFGAALELHRANKDTLGEGRDLDDMALDHLLTGRFQDALALYRQALDVYVSGKQRVGEADIHNKLGAALQRLGRYTEAEAEYRESLTIAEELQARAGVQQARANLAGLHVTTGRYREAIAGYEESLQAFRKLESRGSEALVLGNLGRVYARLGNLERALDLHRQALQIHTELKDPAAVAGCLYSIADLEADRTRYGEALAGFGKALETFRSAGLKLETANTLSAQANVYRRLGKTPEALALYEESRQIRLAIGDGPGLARIGGSIGGVHQEAGRYPEALRAYEEALQGVRTLGEKPYEPGLLNNLGMVLRHLKRPADAADRLRQAVQVSRELGDPFGEAGALGNLGYIEFLQGKLAEAERSYRHALSLAGPERYPEIAFRCRIGLALLHRQRKQWRAAARELAPATGLIDRIRGEAREQSLQTSFFEQYVSPFHLQADSLLAAGEPAAAYLVAERARARALVDILRNGKASVTRSMTPAEQETETGLVSRLSALSAEVREARYLPTDQLLARETRLTEARGALEQFRRRLYLDHPDLQSHRGAFSPPTLTHLNGSLFARDPGLGVLSYLVGRTETLLFVLTAGKTPAGPASLRVVRIPVGRDRLEEQVREFWGACSQPGGEYRMSGTRLYRTLVLPAAKELAGLQQLVVIPDGPLHLLPFQALPDARGRHLMEQTAVSYAPSVTALAAMTALGDRRRSERPQPGTLPMLALGRPKLDAGLADLAATEKEVQSIAALVGPETRPFTGAEASEERLKREAPRARFLHLATHGLLNEAAPLYSALALAHGPDEDGLLEAREVMDLDLQAELVVLSACETALGKTVSGEGVLGLTWSLFVAGAPSTVVSHWQVEDETTGTLMAEFYRRLAGVPSTPQPTRSKPTISKARALRAAQLAVMRDKSHAHPYYWAPYILVGDWRGGLRSAN